MSKPRKLNVGGGVGRLTSSAEAASKGDLLVIDDEALTNPVLRDKVLRPVINGMMMGQGLVKRDWALDPPRLFATPPKDMVLVPRSEWDARFEEQEANQSSLRHLRRRAGPGGGHIRALNQGREGFCWAYSTTMAVMLTRAKNNQPYARLSAHAIGCMVMNFQNRGGWCGLSAKFHRERGCPSVAYWPEQSMSRANDKPATWENAALHQVTEEFADLTRPVHDQNLTDDQIATCLFNNQPVALDYDEWGHSICGMQWRRIERGSFGPLILNSWDDDWGDLGEGAIRLGWTVDGAVATLAAGGSAA